MNKYLVVIGLIVAAFLAGYFLMPQKTIKEEVEVIKYVKVNTHSVTVTNPDGSSTTTTDSTSDTQENTNSNTITEINKRSQSVIAFAGIGNNKRLAGAMYQRDLSQAFGFVAGAMYDTREKTAFGLIGLNLKW